MCAGHRSTRNRLRLLATQSLELLRLRETQTKAGQASLFIALETSKLHLRRLSGLQLRHQFHPPHHLRHQLTLVT
jgi:hypothetical protein